MWAADDDTQLRLTQNIDQQKIQQEKNLREADIHSNTLPNMVIDGETIQVNQQDINDVGRALYISVMQKRWQAVSLYLDVYVKLPQYDPSLALFAQGALSRSKGQLKQAENDFRKSSQLQPNNIITQLELARVLTEQQKNNDATVLFQKIKKQLIHIESDSTAQNISKTVDMFLNGLQQRDHWHGTLAVGPIYGKNINSSSGVSSTTIYYVLDSSGSVNTYYYTRSAPKPAETGGLEYEGTVSKRWSLNGNHGLALRGLAYGDSYDDYSQYNESTINLNLGYSYLDQKNQFVLAPQYENYRYANAASYNAWGLHGEWIYFLSADKMFKLETDIKHLKYQEYKNFTGTSKSVSATFFKVLPQQWTVFSGLDYLDHPSKEHVVNSFEQEGIRLGISKQFKFGLNATLFGSFRWRQFDEYAASFDARRHDFEQNYTLVFQAPKLSFYGFTPNLTYRLNRNNSNVDWLYSYDKQTISIKLQRSF